MEMMIPSWFSRLRFAFSRRSDGQMSFRREDERVVVANRRRFLARHGLSLNDVAAGELIHGARIVAADRSDRGRGAFTQDYIPGADGLATRDAGLLLLTTHADCVPFIIYDDERHTLGQAHAGWRGLAAGIVNNLLEAVQSPVGSSPDGLMAWLGPSVRPCCYPVGEEVLRLFPEECVIRDDGAVRLDLQGFICGELVRLGLPPENVFDSGVCTSCEVEYSSFRRERTDVTAMACVFGMV